jgi:hypothetical protein
MLLQITASSTDAVTELDEEDENFESSFHSHSSGLPESAWQFNHEALVEQNTAKAKTSGKKSSIVDLIPVFGETTMAELMAASPQAGADIGILENSATHALEIIEDAPLLRDENPNIQQIGIHGDDGKNSINAIT